jgi:hypothetical protein
VGDVRRQARVEPHDGALTEVVAKQSIADTLARFCERIDEYDIDGVVDLFTEDCATDYGPGRGGPLKGREPLRQRLRRSQAENKRTHHQLGQVRVVLEGKAVAHSIAYVTAWHELWNGEIRVARLQYRDRFVRETAGWAIAERLAVVTGVDGFEPEQWNWLVRRRVER